MKYVAIIDSGDKELSEEVIKELKNTTFWGDEENPYYFEMTSIKEVPGPAHYDSFWGNFYYNNALKDCGVIEDEK